MWIHEARERDVSYKNPDLFSKSVVRKVNSEKVYIPVVGDAILTCGQLYMLCICCITLAVLFEMVESGRALKMVEGWSESEVCINDSYLMT